MQPQISNTFTLSAEKPAVSVDHINNYYLLTATRTVPAVNDPGWVLVAPGGQIPVPVTATPYLWHKAVTVLTDGSELDPYVEFGGSLGQNGIDYDLVPSHSTIIHKEDDSYDPTQVSCGLILRNADGTATQQSSVPAGYSVQVSIDNGTASAYTLGTNIATANHTVISFILKYGSIVIERHDIRVFTEGSQGLQGRGIYSMDTRFKANATGTTPTCSSDADWAGWSALSGAGYSSDNKYLFRCVRTVYLEPDGTYSTPEFVIDGPTVWGHDGIDGVDGADSYKVDLSNESDIIPVDADRKIVGTPVVLSTTLRFYKGATGQSISKPNANSLTIAGVAPSIVPQAATSPYYDLTWTIPVGLTITNDRYEVELVASGAHRATFSVAVVKSGQSGVSPAVYQLLPSASEFIIARTSNKGYNPSSVALTCGYTKTQGTSAPTTVSHSTSRFDGYDIFFRRRYRSNSNWENSLWYRYRIYQSSKLNQIDVSLWKEVQFIICTNNTDTFSDGSETGKIDTETVPIVIDGANGYDGEDGIDGQDGQDGDDGNGIESDVFYYTLTTTQIEPSTTNLDVQHGWYRRIDQGCPQAATKQYPFLWECEHIQYTRDTSLNKKILRLINFYNQDTRPQLLKNTAFDGVLSSVWNFLTNAEVNPEANGACAGVKCFPYYQNAYSYADYLDQVVYFADPTKGRIIKPSTWYTFSFYSRIRQYVNYKLTGRSYYVFTNSIYLRAGRYRVRFNGHISTAAKNSGYHLTLALFGPNQTWNYNCNASIMSDEDVTVTGSNYMDVPSDGNYSIEALQYDNYGNLVSTYDMFINWYSIICDTDSNRISTYLFPGVSDPAVDCFIDGVPGDIWYDAGTDFLLKSDEDVADSDGWVRHYVTFKTCASLDVTSGSNHWTPDTPRQVRFRTWRSFVEISKPKLEEGFLPTEWCEMEGESITDCTHNPRGTWKSSGSVSDPEDATYYYCNGVRDVVQALAEPGSTTLKYWRLKHRTSSAGYSNSVQPCSDPEHWEEASHFKFVVVDAMFAEEINSANIIAQKVRVYNQARTKALIIDPGETYPFQMGPVGAPNVKIDIDGKITASGADITGKITATSGKIGGFTISGNTLTGGNNAELAFGSGSKMTLGSSPFISTYANLSYSKTVEINGGIGAYIPQSYSFSCKENARVTLSVPSGGGANFDNFFAANIFEISYYSKRFTSGNDTRYGFQYAMIGSGHVVMDGIVDGVCCDKITYSNNYEIKMLRPPLHSNRIIINSSKYYNHLALPDILSLFTTVGTRFIKSSASDPSMFTFKMDFVNIGNPVGILGRNSVIETSDGKIFNIYDYPKLFRNRTEMYGMSGHSYYYGFYLDTNQIISVLFVYDSSLAEAQRFRAYINEDYDTIYTPPGY